MGPTVDRIPVILDTDIGGDIDDTWALAMLLKCPELDVKLVVSDTGDSVYRAKIIARVLEIADRTDIPIGVGIRQQSDGPRERQARWVEGYDLSMFPGALHHDGVSALIDTIVNSPEPVTLICIGPVPNIAAALEREPAIAERTRFVGMHGSIRRHHDGGDGPIAEYNVSADIPACQKVFAAPWRNMTITPLDTCGQVRLSGRRYRRISRSEDAVAGAVMENYRIWAQGMENVDPSAASSILFDTVAVHLASSTRHLVMERMRLAVDDRGFTVADPAAREMNVAIDWQNLDAYLDFLTDRLLGSVAR